MSAGALFLQSFPDMHPTLWKRDHIEPERFLNSGSRVQLLEAALKLCHHSLNVIASLKRIQSCKKTNTANMSHKVTL